MGQLRILAIAPTSYFADYGCHVRIRGQLGAVRALGHQVLLVTYPSGRDVDALATVRAPWPGAGPIQVGSSRLKIALDAVLGPTAVAAGLRFRPDIVHAYLHEGALIGALVAALLRRPLLFDFQGSLTGEMLDHRFIAPGSPWLALFRGLEHWIDRRPDLVLASSAHGAALLAGDFGVAPARIIVLPDCIDPNHFRPGPTFDPATQAALRERLHIPGGRRLIVYLGLLAPYQGTDLLLQALAILVQKYADVHLLLMGFPHVEHYRALARTLGVCDRVTFTGAVAYEDAASYLALGDAAVAPKLSATEGSGKLLAYMAAGLPVAAFDTPVHREYLGESASYAPAGEADGLADALARLLADSAGSSAQGRWLRGKVLANYTWDQAAGILDKAYRGCLPASGMLR